MAPAINYVARDYRFKMCFATSKVENTFYKRTDFFSLASYLWSGKLALNSHPRTTPKQSVTNFFFYSLRPKVKWKFAFNLIFN